MKRRILIVCVFALFVSLLSPIITHANSVRYFKFSTTSNTGDTVYLKELGQTADKGKAYYVVEYDNAGRIISVERIYDTATYSKCFRSYNADSKVHTETVCYSATQRFQSKSKFHRDKNDNILKVERFDNDNRITSYYTCSYQERKYECAYYSNEGKKISDYTDYFNSDSVIIKSHSVYPISEITHNYDSTTGLVISSRQTWSNNNNPATIKYYYDDDGIRLKEEATDSYGIKFEVKEYKGGLLSKITSDTNRGYMVWDLVYDSDRYLINIFFRRNGQQICTFSVERHSNGTVKRTVAYDTRNNIIAEYPNNVVYFVYKDGKSTNGFESKVYVNSLW